MLIRPSDLKDGKPFTRCAVGRRRDRSSSANCLLFDFYAGLAMLNAIHVVTLHPDEICGYK